MRHGINGRKLNRHSDERKALFKSLAVSLLKHEQLTTTLPKAKDLRPIVERLITLGKRGGLSCRRQAISFLGSKDIAAKIMGPLAERYQNRQGGYIRIIKAGFRYGDNAPLAVIELIDRDITAKGGQSSEALVEKAAEEQGAKKKVQKAVETSAPSQPKGKLASSPASEKKSSKSAPKKATKSSSSEK